LFDGARLKMSSENLLKADQDNNDSSF